MRSKRTKTFHALFNALPVEAQQQAHTAYQLFKQDPAHPSLHFKQVNERRGVWSVRVGLHYRALGVRRGDEIAWFWIGTHAKYDKLVSQ